MRKLAFISLAVAVLAAPSAARATVDSYLPYYIPYRDVQTDSYCLMERVALVEIGIPEGAAMLAVAAPALIFQSLSGIAETQTDINVASGIEAELTNIDYNSDDVVDVSIKVTVQDQAAQQNQLTTAERRKLLTAAKLYLVALAESLQRIRPYHWRLYTQIVGLPTQEAADGTPLYQTNKWPFTYDSKLLNLYRSELLNRSDDCMKMNGPRPAKGEQAGGGSVSEPSPVAGCAVTPPTSAATALLLFGLGWIARRRRR
ncbi:MAG: hypothetical protein H6707_17710 [Deltaproteobacteria bacterium]|nr:hypothetical protein [Deltaproteobacteria bacterium]